MKNYFPPPFKSPVTIITHPNMQALLIKPIIMKVLKKSSRSDRRLLQYPRDTKCYPKQVGKKRLTEITISEEYNYASL